MPALKFDMVYPNIEEPKKDFNMPWGSLISGGASLIGGLLARRGAKEANAARVLAAKTQMDFQERMSSTAHQREIKDLRAAGLNPILSATGGRGASSPGGAMNQVENELEPALNSAMAVARTAAELKAIKATTAQTKAATINTQAATKKTNKESLILDDTKSSTTLDATINESEYGQILRIIERLIPGANSASNIVNQQRSKQ